MTSENKTNDQNNLQVNPEVEAGSIHSEQAIPVSETLNAAWRLTEMANKIPDSIAIAVPRYRFSLFGKKKPLRNSLGKRLYQTITFRELDRDTDRIARELLATGFKPGMKLALMVRQGIDFIALVFALYKMGAILVLIDPGMGIARMLKCLREANPDGFIAISTVQAARCFLRSWFPNAKHNLTVGSRWFWGGPTLSQFRKKSYGESVLYASHPNDPAAIIFTSGSTGLAKGVLYTHRIIDTQVEEIAQRYHLVSGAVDLAGFPFFGLYNAAMGTTAVIPDMDSSHPASVNPELFLEAANDWKITQSFGSPALWNRVVNYCVEHHCRMGTLKRAISAGAPVPFTLLEKFLQCISPEGDIHTPYGATESLPVASITAREILAETAEKSREGAGTCVGHHFSKIEWKIIPISDGPIANMSETKSLPIGQIGELVVCGPQVTTQYVTRLEANALAKIKDEQGRIWHRIGDVGYIDEKDRFWFCGRKTHRVVATTGKTYFSIPCEAIANQHTNVFRSALVGVKTNNENKPIIIIEPKPGFYPQNEEQEKQLKKEVLDLLAQYPHTKEIDTILLYKQFPVDVRHNAKINREKLAQWARKQIH